MPMDRRLYPVDWDAIAFAVKTAAQWKCEDCGKVCRRPDESLEDFARRAQLRLTAVQQAPKRWELTVAHLNHRPEDCHRDNLKALCAPCHCRYDLSQMPLKKRLKLERAGQLPIKGIL
jgi:hypothetical protein